MRLFKLVSRAFRLRCPICGGGRLFRGWFTMHETCSQCGVKFEREPGFFLGSIYFNYGLTAILTSIAYPLLRAYRVVPNNVLMPVVVGVAVLFPLWFFRYARSLWCGFDEWVDSREKYEGK